MSKTRRHLYLAQKSLRADLGRNVGPQDFYGNGALVPKVPSEEYNCHSTFAQLPLNCVAACEAGFEALLKVAQEATIVNPNCGNANTGPL